MELGNANVGDRRNGTLPKVNVGERVKNDWGGSSIESMGGCHFSNSWMVASKVWVNTGGGRGKEMMIQGIELVAKRLVLSKADLENSNQVEPMDEEAYMTPCRR